MEVRLYPGKEEEGQEVNDPRNEIALLTTSRFIKGNIIIGSISEKIVFIVTWTEGQQMPQKDVWSLG